METISAIYENGVFRPTEPVDLPEHARVRVGVENGVQGEEEDARSQLEIYWIMGERYESGDPHGAERHNEHQP